MAVSKALADLISHVSAPSDAQVFNFILTNLKARKVEANHAGNEGYDPSLSPEKCEDFEELVASLRTKLHMTQGMEDCLLVMIAIAISIKIAGPNLWCHVVGPASSAKTTLLKLVSAASNFVYSVAELTSMFSGWKSEKDDSLVPKIQNKMFAVEDLTPLLTSPPALQDSVFGSLRVLFDGSGRKHYSNGVVREYEGVRFTMLTCVTDIIRAFNRSDIGERFVQYEINSFWTDDGKFKSYETENDPRMDAALDSILDTMACGFENDDKPKLDLLDKERGMCWGLLTHLFEYISDSGTGLQSITSAIGTDLAFREELKALAQWIAYARCPVQSKAEATTVRPRAEMPYRIIKQLPKLATSMCIVLKTSTVPERVKRIVRKMAFDTCLGHILEIMNLTATSHRVYRDQLAFQMHLSTTHVSTMCKHLVALGVLEEDRDSNGSGNRGNKTTFYKLTPKLRALATTLKLNPPPPPASSAAKLSPTGKPSAPVVTHRLFQRPTSH